MEKLKLSFAVLWESVVALVSPFWVGFTYLCITGHGKGYDYDLQSETDVSIALGVAFAMLWLAAAVPVYVWLTRRLYRKNKKLALLPLGGFLLLCAAGATALGWDTFFSAFTG